jgi:steroid 5-alpha reductase family enzyme
MGFKKPFLTSYLLVMVSGFPLTVRTLRSYKDSRPSQSATRRPSKEISRCERSPEP